METIPHIKRTRTELLAIIEFRKARGWNLKHIDNFSQCKRLEPPKDMKKPPYVHYYKWIPSEVSYPMNHTIDVPDFAFADV